MVKPSKDESDSSQLDSEDDPLVTQLEQELSDLPVGATASESKFSDTQRKRVWPSTYACTVVALGFLLFGFTMGFNSPVLSSLKSRTGYTSLHKTRDQDLFNVSILCGRAT